MRSLWPVVIILAAATTRAADIPPIDMFEASIEAPAHIWVTPEGNGPALTEAYAQDGSGVMDATISVQLVDWNGDPIVNYPHEDIWLESLTSLSFCFCPGGTVADTDSDVNGEVLFFSPPQAGGQVAPGESVNVMVAGDTTPNLAVPLSINGPDINGDLEVNLADVTVFVQALNSNDDWRADFNLDGEVNLTEVTIMARALGLACP